MEWKRHLLLIISLAVCLNGYSQSGKADTTYVNNLLQKSKDFTNTDPAKAIDLAQQALEAATEINFPRGQAYALKSVGIGYYIQGEYIEALEYWNQSLKIFELLNDEVGISNLLNNIGAVYLEQGNDSKALQYCLKSLEIAEKTGDNARIVSALINIGGIYHNKQDARALTYLLKALALSEELNNKEMNALISGNIGEIYFDMGNNAKALEYYQKAINIEKNTTTGAFAYNGIGKVYQKKGNFPLALQNHQKALDISEKIGEKMNRLRSLKGIANVNTKQNKYTEAFKSYQRAKLIGEEIDAKVELKDLYQEMALAYSSISDYKNAFLYNSLYADIKDTLYNIETAKKLDKLQFDFDLYKKQGEINLLTKNKELQDSKLKEERASKEVITIAMVLLLIIAVIIYRNYQVKLGTSNTLEKQNQEINEAYQKLKNTQAQLIQKEKMASLGELTAGIAHEIQNPLNFVNNFSEVSTELLDELEVEATAGNTEVVQAITADLRQNLQKIHHHGKRADSIVKNMLLHSRSSNGKKEPTDLNALADEYLRLAYHGVRAQDNSFNAKLVTQFDPALGKVEIVPQEMGRVLLNLYNNAFYVVQQKAQKEGKEFQPQVSVHTLLKDGKVVLRVRDNGTGIPEEMKQKIFQPFFTTKPSGAGTGLGLSLSYDIITKGHNGEFSVESTEGEYTEFIVQLPKGS